MMKITLEDITKDNYEEVMALELLPGQDEFVSPNSESIAESKFNPYCRPRAILLDGKVAGFAMYERCDEEGHPNDYNLYRMMVDKSFQNQGIGSGAMDLLLDEMKQLLDCHKITVCYDEKSAKHRQFYQRFGFKETGYDEDYEEMIAEIVVRSK